MSIIITGTTCVDAWKAVSAHIISTHGGEDTNVLVKIISPCDFSSLDLWVKKYNPSNVHPQGDEIRRVINTIFPYTLRVYFINRTQFYEKYGKVFNRSHNKKWGTYFQRLISFGKKFEAQYPNQLENAIQALQGGSPQKHFITFHLTASNIESNVRPLGGPCWQYGELVINSDGKVDLMAVYRNHDYFNKAFGNFIGLGQLLKFICEESGKQPGAIVIHSIHAYSSEGINRLTQLIN